MTQRLLHGDAHHRVTLFPGPAGSRRAVVCFEPGRERMAGFEPAAAPHFAARLGLDALVVQTARRDWFLSPASPALAAALRRATANYAEVCLSGFSMGGYGALLYSAACHGVRAMVVSPQYCIDPAVAPWDPGRHDKFRRIGQPMPLPQSQGDPRLGGIVLYDPAIPEDRQHARHVLKAFPAMTGVALPHGGHPASGVLGEAGRVGRIAEMVIADRIDGAALRDLHRRARRNSARYRLNLALAGAARHGAHALPVLAELARTAAPRLRLEAGLALLPLDREQGIAALLQLLEDTPEAPRAWAGRIERALAS
ncbi:hypothetical protein [Paracoccus yeei]|uniref:hypothetical protein n=1 Tax=Paracoccus yeei TaxID=147645 RepID=UPI00242CF0DF|nr:hypothetical protein [Paracoccus yeei]